MSTPTDPAPTATGPADPGTTAPLHPWPAGSASGVGSLPGDDPLEAARTVLELVPGLPFLPELPARGAPADLAGRGAALLHDMPVDLQPSGWRLVSNRSGDGARARDLLARDVDDLELAAGLAGHPVRLKVQVTGPWTLASTVELTRGDKALADHGAVRDLTSSLAEGVRLHLADLQRRLPDTVLVLQVDEPALPTVIGGGVPTSSGWGRLRVPSEQVVRERLAEVLAVSPHRLVHCCARRPPIGLFQRAGATGLSLDATLLTPYDDDALGLAVEAGLGLLMGCVPGTDAVLSDPAGTLRPVRGLWRRLGLDPALVAATVVVTPTCGLAGASPAYARAALTRCVEAGELLREEPE